MIIEFPLTYNARHLLKGRKQAQLSVVSENYYLDIPEISAEQAPVVARLHLRTVDKEELTVKDQTYGYGAAKKEIVDAKPNGIRYGINLPCFDETVEYRVGKSSDGEVRLLAKSLGSAFQTNIFQPNEAVSLRGIPAITSISCQTDYQNLSQIGTLISSARDQAIDNLSRAAQHSICIDGELWMAARTPGWRFITIHNNQMMSDKSSHSIMVAAADPTASKRCFNTPGAFVPFCKDYREAVNTTIFAEYADKLLSWGSIEEVVPGIIDADWRWRNLYKSARAAINASGELQKSGFFQEDFQAFNQLKEKLAFWPEVRNQALIHQTIKVCRTVHSIKSAGNAEMMEQALLAVKRLKEVKAPLTLAERIKKSGLEIPVEISCQKPPVY